MTRGELAKLETILGRIEALQNQTKDDKARERLGVAKSELILLWRESDK